MTESPDIATMFTPEFWDERYAAHGMNQPDRPNVRLVEHAAGLAPGRALDLGCGEGGDARWLAARGWQVLAGDLSGVAIEHAAARSAGRPGAERITWRQLDAQTWEPPAEAFELVAMHYLHMPLDALADLLTRLAAAVTPGGRLLITAHDPHEIGEGVRPHGVPELMHTAAQIAALLDDSVWDVEVADVFSRRSEHPDGESGVVTMWDTVVLAVRRDGLTAESDG